MEAAPRDDVPFDMRQQLARIDATQAEIANMRVNTDIMPFSHFAATIGVTIALIAAGAAFEKLVIG